MVKQHNLRLHRTRLYGVAVSTRDFDSRDLGSTPSTTFLPERTVKGKKQELLLDLGLDYFFRYRHSFIISKGSSMR